MKTFALLLLLFSLTNCQKGEVDPDEVKAAILDFSIGRTACGGNYRLQLENGTFYRTFSLPAPYNDASNLKLPASVWIRYQSPIGNCSQTPGLINVTAIKPR